MSVTAIRRKHNVLADAAELVRLLAAAEHAHLLGDEQRLEILLGQVTPSTCSEVATQLDALALQARLAHTATRSELLAAAAPALPPQGDATGAGDEPPLAPVVHIDRHSRRV